MKFLLDENLSHKLLARLAPAFPDTVRGDGVGRHGQPYTAIRDYAGQQGFMLLYQDDRFRQLSSFRGTLVPFRPRIGPGK